MSHGRIKVYDRTAALTSTSLADIVPAQSGFSYSLRGLIAVNDSVSTNGIKIFNGDRSITPTIYVGGSGTFIWDVPGGGYEPIAIGSGIGGALSSAGTFTVTAYYTLIDERTPVTKENARQATFIGAKSIRAPNPFGGQELT